MAEFPVLPLFTDAYLGDTTHLTTIEHGAYLLLLIVEWRSSDCRLPDDDRLLARYTRMTGAQWKRLRPAMEPFFDIKDGFWIQSRLMDEHNHVRQVRDRQAEGGRASALKRKGRHAGKLGGEHVGKREESNRRNGRSPPTPSPSPPEELGVSSDTPAGNELETLLPEHVVSEWNQVAERLAKPRVRDITPERRVLIKARIAQYSINDFVDVFGKVERSPFLRGDNGAWGGCTFDWIMKKSNFQKILEGNYDH